MQDPHRFWMTAAGGFSRRGAVDTVGNGISIWRLTGPAPEPHFQGGSPAGARHPGFSPWGRWRRLAAQRKVAAAAKAWRSEEHTSELQSLMRISYAVFCLKK